MASVNASDIPDIQQFMNPLWSSIKKFYGIELTDEYSAEVMDHLDELIEQFPHPLCKELTLALMKYINSEQRKMQEEERRIRNEQQP